MNRATKITRSDERVKLGYLDYFNHYSLALFPLMFPAFYLFNKLTGREVVNEFSIEFIIGAVVVAILLLIFRWRDLYFYELNATRTEEEFEKAIYASQKKLHWRNINFEKNIVTAIVYGKYRRNELSEVMIKWKWNKVLYFSNSIFLGFNKKQVAVFYDLYLQSSQVENLVEKVNEELLAEEVRLESESEWSFKNTLKRLVAYLFSFGFLAIGILIVVFENFNFMCLPFLALGLAYPLMDIYVLLSKTKRGSKMVKVVDSLFTVYDDESDETRARKHAKGREIFSTENLSVRRMVRRDKSNFVELMTDSRIIELDAGQGVDMFEVKKSFELNLEEISFPIKNRENVWAVFEEGSQEMIGATFLYTNDEEDWVLDYQFRFKYTDKGYDTELAQSMIAYCFEIFKIEKLIAEVDVQDVESVLILDKLMNPVKEYRNQDDQRLERRYEIERVEWLR